MRQTSGARTVAGFTLMEILVVLAIVAIMVAAVGLSVGAGGGERRLETEAQRLVALVELACDESAQTGQDIGVRFDSAGYRFLRAVGREWKPHASDALRARRLPDGMQLELAMGDRSIELDAAPVATSSPSGGGDVSTERDRAVRAVDFTPHLACDAEGVLSGDARIGLRAGRLLATLARDKEGSLRLMSPEAP